MPPHILCATSTSTDGNMDFRFGETDTVLKNRTNFLETHGLSLASYIPMQSNHKDIIVVVDRNTIRNDIVSRGEELEADVLITQEKDLALMLTTADCQAVSFYEPVSQTIALAHISRHTLAQNLARRTVVYLTKHCRAHPSDLLVCISPYIHKKSYKFSLPLESISPILAPFIEEKDGFAHIDMLGATLHQLTHAGVLKENVTVSGIDTAVSSEHFSFYRATRKNTKDARMATILAMRS